MKNSLFDPESINIILDSGNWRIISSLFNAEMDFTLDQAHTRWMRTNTESHPAREILFVLKGSGIYGYMNTVYPCQPGAIFFINSYESHDSYYPKDHPDVLHLWISLFEHDAVAKVIERKAGKERILWTPVVFNQNRMADLLATTWDETAASPTLPAVFVRAKLMASFSAMMMEIVEQGFGKITPHAQSNFQTQVIETIRRHIAKTAGRDVPLSEAARLAGYSQFHFHRLFKQETGQTFHQYVDACRLKKARAMFRERRTKTEISEALGFTHLSTFLRWMKSRDKRGGKRRKR